MALKFIQVNAQRSMTVAEEIVLLLTTPEAPDVVLIQEPYLVDGQLLPAPSYLSVSLRFTAAYVRHGFSCPPTVLPAAFSFFWRLVFLVHLSC